MQVSFFFLYVQVKYLNIIIGYIERIIVVLLHRVEISEIKCQAEESVEKNSTTVRSMGSGSPAGIKLYALIPYGNRNMSREKKTLRILPDVNHNNYSSISEKFIFSMHVGN